MPRDGSGTYTQPFPDVVEGTTIESAVFNTNTADVVQDLNAARPIVAGGTGANNARDAMIALKGEIAKQGPVDNFNTFPFANGTWYCNSGATGAPLNAAFSGSYYELGNPGYATLEARQVAEVLDSPVGPVFVKQKVAGVWATAWTMYDGMVPASGGVPITGPMNITNATASTSVDTGALTVDGGVGMNGSLNVGGTGTFGSNIYTVGDLFVGYGTAGGVIRFANDPNKYLYFNGTNYSLNGGGVLALSGGLDVTTTGAFGGTLAVTGLATIYGGVNTNAINASSINASGTITTSSEFRSGSTNSYRHVQGNYGIFQHQNGTDCYWMLTNAGDQYGSFNSLRPLRINLATGNVAMAHHVDAGELNVAGMAVYGGIPVTHFAAEGYVTSAVDAQKMLCMTGGSAVTITVNGGVHPVGTTISFFAYGNWVQINNTETMMWRNASGSPVTGQRQLQQYGVCTIHKWTSGNWVISGNGVT